MAKSSQVDKRADLIKHLTQDAARDKGDGSLMDVAEWAEAFPTLNAFLTCNKVGDKPRQVPTITFWVEDVGIKCVLADRASKRKLWAVAPSLGSLWGELEASLTARSVDWRSEAGTKVKRS